MYCNTHLLCFCPEHLQHIQSCDIISTCLSHANTHAHVYTQGKEPLLYVTVLLLSLQFHAALRFLWKVCVLSVCVYWHVWPNA